MRVSHVKSLRKALIGLIALVLIAVAFDYLQTWRQRAGAVMQAAKILGSEMLRSADSIEYSDHQDGVIKFKVRAEKLLETRQGRTLLQGIEAFDFNPDGSVSHHIRSRSAEYLRNEKQAIFTGDVRIQVGEGIELRTESLHYDLNANRGETSERLKLISPEASGTARGVTYEHAHQILTMRSDLDFTLRRKIFSPDGSSRSEDLRVTAQHGVYSGEESFIRFQGGARLQSVTALLTGETIEATFHPQSRQITSLICKGSALYQSQGEEDITTLSGEHIRFGLNPATGALEEINVREAAEFRSRSAGTDQDLRASLIDLDLDAARGLPRRLSSQGNVQLHTKRAGELTEISGSYLEAPFFTGTNLPEQMLVRGRARMRSARGGGKDDLEAEEILISFRLAQNKSVPVRLLARERVLWETHPRGREQDAAEPLARALSAASLTMNYAPDGDSLEYGNASGSVVLMGVPLGGEDRTEIRRLEADAVRFVFFPGENRLRNFEGDNNVVVTHYQPASDKSPEQSFRTRSTFIKASFRHSDGAAEAISQWGNFLYQDESKEATAGRAEYRADTEVLSLRIAPAITDENGTTTGEHLDYDRKSGILSVRDRVRTVFRPKSQEPAGPFGSTSRASPSVVTADAMEYWNNESRARYTGSVVLLSEDGQLRARVLEVRDAGGRIDAWGGVQHIIFRNGSTRGTKSGEERTIKEGAKTTTSVKKAQVHIDCGRLWYTKEQNSVHYSEKVLLRSEDVRLEADTLDAVMESSGGEIDRAAARGDVSIRQADREATGELADYFLSPGKVVVVGSPANIADPSRGKSFARRLTFFTADDRILLESQ